MKWTKSRYPGVRFREHPTRRHGMGFDRYFTIYSKLNGKTIEEPVGWASQGMTEKKAAAMLSELQENRRRGEGPKTLREKREIEERARQAQEEKTRKEKRDLLTFGEVFSGKYFETVNANRKNPESPKWEDALFRKWIGPVIGEKPLKDIAPLHLEKIKSIMAKAEKAPRTIQYALAVVRQVFNFARNNRLFDGENPVSKVKMPKFDNRRTRFLTQDEAEKLLQELSTRSTDLHDQALLSLYTGMRAGEVFSLTWADIDFGRSILTLKDTKSAKTRQAFMTERVRAMLEARRGANNTGFVFPGRKGQHSDVSRAFDRAVKRLGLNDGIDDRRQRVTFHTLRHSFASWLVEQGTDLYFVKELLGHSDFAMTSRYAHLAPNTLQAAVKRLEKPTSEKVVQLRATA